MDLRFINKGFYVLVLIAIACTASSAAIAQVNFTTNEGQFIADNPGLAFQDFSVVNATPGSSTICNVPVDSNSNGPCFSPGEILPGISFDPSNNSIFIFGLNFNGNNNPANVLASSAAADTLDILFSQNTDAVGVTLGCIGNFSACSGNLDIEVFGAGDVLLGSTSLPVTGLNDSFLGIISNESITKVNLDATSIPSTLSSILNVRFGERLPAITLSPVTATNEVLTDHTVTATVLSGGTPQDGVLVSFEVISGPNAGEMSGPGSGECTPNDDCTTDAIGEVSWTYTGSNVPGTDTIKASFEDIDIVIESNNVTKVWVLPPRNVPTLSEWGLVTMAGILGIVGFMVMRRKKVAA